MFTLAGVSTFAHNIDRFNNTVPAGDKLIFFIKCGFVLIACIFVGVLAMRGSEGRNRIKRNKAKNNRPIRSKTNELGSGDLAVKKQIEPWLVKHDKYDTVIPVRDIKGGDGIAMKSGHLVIPAEERNRHILVIAKTGSGKTTRAILPVLFNDVLCQERSTIVIDSKPEMWDKLVGMARKYNPKKKLLLFNPLDTSRGLSWNIIGKIHTDTDAKLIANTVISATDNPSSRSDSPFFRNNALSLLNSIMVGLLSDNNEVLSMPRVHQLVNGGMEPLCKWLEAHPDAIRNSKTFVDLARSGSQNADTIMSELGMRLAAWDLSAIRATTALNELDLESLIHEPSLLVIELRESELEMLRPMANVLVVEMLRFLTKRAESFPSGKLPMPISLVIDEFASALGRLPDIHVKLNTLRSRNVSIVAAIQSIAQIKSNYDKEADSVLSGFSTKIFMPTLDFQDSEWASKESGTMTVRFNANSIGKNKRMIDYFSNNNDNIQEHIQQRAVLTPDEIGRPADNAATFFMPNTPVFQGHLVPYYEDPDLSSKFNSSRGIDFKLREKPIEFEDVVPEYVPSTPANQAPASTAQQTPEQIWAEVAEHKKQFAYEQADSISKEWWQSLEKLNEKNPIAVFNLSQQLVNRRLTLAEFYNFYATSGIDNVENLLQALDTKRLEQLRFALGWDLANQHAKDWWVSFEEANKNNIGTIMELGQELLKRAVSVDDFFSAYVHSDSSSVPDVLKVLDKMIEEKKQELEKNPPPIEDSSEDISGIGYTDVFGKDEDVADSYKTTQLDEEDVVDPFSLWEQGQGSTNRDSDYSANNNDSLSSKIEVLDDKVDSYDKETTDGISFDDLSGAGNGGGNSDFDEPYVTPREAKKKAVANVHVRSYIEMAEELIGQGKAGDIEKLIILAKDDEMFPNEFLADLENIKNNALGL